MKKMFACDRLAHRERRQAFRPPRAAYMRCRSQTCETSDHPLLSAAVQYAPPGWAYWSLLAGFLADLASGISSNGNVCRVRTRNRSTAHVGNRLDVGGYSQPTLHAVPASAVMMLCFLLSEEREPTN